MRIAETRQKVYKDALSTFDLKRRKREPFGDERKIHFRRAFYLPSFPLGSFAGIDTNFIGGVANVRAETRRFYLP